MVGEPRLEDLSTQTWLVEIRSPLTHQVLATFHEKPKGIWVERVRIPTPSTTPIDLQARIADGQALLDELPAFLERASTRAERPERTPFGIELLYHQHASRLERAVAAIESALTKSNVSDTPAASEVRTALSQAVTDLYQRANQYVSTALKQHPPTVAGVEWLKNHDAITIEKTINRRRLKSATPDYLDEYTLSDHQTQEVLWYAHFHYSTDWTPAKAYLGTLENPGRTQLGCSGRCAQRVDHRAASRVLPQ